MRVQLLLPLLLSTVICSSQGATRVSRADTSINFFGLKPLDLYPYNNRVVPFSSDIPLYVQISYKEGKQKNFEYFRMDSNHYLVYEFFRSDRGSSVDGLKSRGVMKVTDRIAGTSTSVGRGIGTFESTTVTHYYKELSKEGEWEEFEDSLFHHISWKGNYTNNSRTGLWKKILYGVGDRHVLEEINYDTDSALVAYWHNQAQTLSVDSLTKRLQGRWQLRSCDAEDQLRMFYSRCRMYDTEYRDDCRDTHYEFTGTKFTRRRDDGCNKFREACTDGTWKIKEKGGHRFIEIGFSNGEVWNLKILYLDNKNNLATERQ